MSDIDLRFLIDTNIAIHARDGTDSVVDRFEERQGAIMMSALSLAELQRGFLRDIGAVPLRKSRLKTLLQSISLVSFDAAAAEAYGDIIAVCGWVKGRDYDRMIAGHAISLGAILVTDNERDFHDIPGLSVENWLSSP